MHKQATSRPEQRKPLTAEQQRLVILKVQALTRALGNGASCRISIRPVR